MFTTRVSFELIPFDVLLLIVRLLPLVDAVSLFMVSKHFFSVSTFRHFWVYANIDIDFLLCRPGHGHIDFSRMSIAALRTRVAEASRVFASWRSDIVEPRRIHTLPLPPGTRQLLAIPWTRVLVIVQDETVYLRDWGTWFMRTVPVSIGPQLYILTTKTFWVDTLQRNVIVVAMAYRQNGTHLRSELQLFVVDFDLDESGEFTVAPIVTVKFEHPITSFALIDQHLAVVGHTARHTYYMRSLKVSYLPTPSVLAKPLVYIGTQGTLVACSFAIMDDTHFLLAGPVGVAVYKLSDRAKPSTGFPRRLKPCWQQRYDDYEFVSRPPLGPIVEHHRTGHKSIAVCSGTFL
ncbi:hypothetical protein C8F04DRAFT_293330 [Mycena alexandri]|uniref:F-box domain-containing protein n=1 Tax=Mycena alexandri TaxID=1745969 RepID=A0AAD6T548_9AGAR|nr:hypothetical protein C8F04DRAFT_293330 [Mycena alexandri]